MLLFLDSGLYSINFSGHFKLDIMEHKSTDTLAQVPPWLRVQALLGHGSTSVVVSEDEYFVTKWISTKDRYCCIRELTFHTWLNSTGIVPSLVGTEYREGFVGLRMKKCYPLDYALGTNLLRTAETRTHVAYSLIQAVAVFHASGLTHQDIKTENIGVIWNETHEQWEVVLLDFGLSLVCDGKGVCSLDDEVRITGVSTMTFTAHMRPPEIVLGSSYRKQSNDIWPLGLILAQLFNSQCDISRYNQAHGAKLQNYVTRYLPWKSSDYLATLSNFSEWTKWIGTQNHGIDEYRQNRAAYFSESQWNLIASCLAWDPHERPRAVDLLRHACFTNVKPVRHLPKVSTFMEKSNVFTQFNFAAALTHKFARYVLSPDLKPHTRNFCIHLCGSFIREEVPEVYRVDFAVLYRLFLALQKMLTAKVPTRKRKVWAM